MSHRISSMAKEINFFNLSLIFSIFVLSTEIAGAGAGAGARQDNVKLYVFGDSYVDTGNNKAGWDEPFGITFPGKPSGRASDGRVITDYIAPFFGINSSLPLGFKDGANVTSLVHGMNFAYGGSGLFNTWASNTMTKQIDRFEELVKKKKNDDFNTSIALISYTGNDYSFYLAVKNGTIQGLAEEIPNHVSQLVTNIKRIQDLGVKRVAVTTLSPRGCWPMVVPPPYKECINGLNKALLPHEEQLSKAVEKLKSEQKSSKIVILELHSDMLKAMDMHKNDKEIPEEYKNPLKPCCVGIADPRVACGALDNNGKKLYKVCEHPEFSFFWDQAHPSQRGWETVLPVLKDSLKELQSVN